jgi:hypothetical protein
MPITGTKQIIEELESLRLEISAVRREVRVLARLLGVEDQLNAALLEHQTQQEADDRARKHRKRAFLSDPDTKD